RFGCFDVLAGMLPNCAVPTCAVREHQFRRMDLDYLVDLTLSENEQDTEINVRLLDLSGLARAIWSKRFELTNGGAHPICELVAMHIAGCISPVIPIIQGGMKRRIRVGKVGFLASA